MRANGDLALAPKSGHYSPPPDWIADAARAFRGMGYTVDQAVADFLWKPPKEWWEQPYAYRLEPQRQPPWSTMPWDQCPWEFWQPPPQTPLPSTPPPAPPRVETPPWLPGRGTKPWNYDDVPDRGW